jgi:guanylate kinase
MKAQRPLSGTRPLLIVLSGPSGVGKDAVLARMKEWGHSLHFAVTVTTRPQRRGESNGVDYHFVSRETFEEMVKGEELLEWAQVYGNFYGVPRRQVEEALEHGSDVLIKVDVQGAATIKQAIPHALLIFISPPSMEALEKRVRQRNTESAIDLERRVATAHEEMRQLEMFDYVVVNDRIDQAVAQIGAIITAEKGQQNTSDAKDRLMGDNPGESA